MTFAAVTHTILAGQSQDFEFAGDISEFAAGITNFNLQYASLGGDHPEPRETHKILTGLTTTPSSGNSVNVTFNGNITDGTKWTGDLPKCFATVTVIAWVGTGASNLFMRTSETPGSKPASTGRTVVAAEAFLSGFNVHFDDSWHFVHSVSASSGLSIQDGGSSIAATGSATLQGAASATGTIDVGLIATLDERSGIGMKDVKFTNSTSRQTIKFAKPVKSIAVFLKSFDIAYDNGENHKISSIYVGLLDSIGGPKENIPSSLISKLSADRKSLNLACISSMDREGGAGSDSSSTNDVTCLLIYSF